MAVRFYKKLEPTNSPILANGSKCAFTSLNHIIGYFATDNAYVQSEFERLMREGRFGMSEIPEAEFHIDFVEPKKKLAGMRSRPLWREEVVAPRSFSGDTQTPSVPRGAVAAAEMSEVAQLVAKAMPVTAEDTPVPVAPSAPIEFKPQTAKRSKLRKS